MSSNYRSRLKTWLTQYSLKHGKPNEFLLASGRRSEWYIDAKLTTCKAEAMPLIGRVFIERIEHNGWRPAAVGGLVIGADPIVMSIARESIQVGEAINAFLVRKEPKKHGMNKFLEGLEDPHGLRVVIIDDVCTTGDSTRIAIDRAREAGLRVEGAICLVDREEGAADMIAKLGFPFDRIFTLGELQAEHESLVCAGAGSERSLHG
ncbi:MAG: orotate phosphoribosyltransferase [Bryobacteraceae bacterium]